MGGRTFGNAGWSLGNAGTRDNPYGGLTDGEVSAAIQRSGGQQPQPAPMSPQSDSRDPWAGDTGQLNSALAKTGSSYQVGQQPRRRTAPMSDDQFVGVPNAGTQPTPQAGGQPQPNPFMEQATQQQSQQKKQGGGGMGGMMSMFGKIFGF